MAAKSLLSDPGFGPGFLRGIPFFVRGGVVDVVDVVDSVVDGDEERGDMFELISGFGVVETSSI